VRLLQERGGGDLGVLSPRMGTVLGKSGITTNGVTTRQYSRIETGNIIPPAKKRKGLLTRNGCGQFSETERMSGGHESVEQT